MQCDACPGEFFNTNGSGTCYACPEGARCAGEAAIEPLPGYWQSPVDPAVMYKCLSDLCLGGINNTCVEGSTGTKCALCEDTYYKVSEGMGVLGWGCTWLHLRGLAEAISAV